MHSDGRGTGQFITRLFTAKTCSSLNTLPFPRIEEAKIASDE
jgi:hypothetical protein